ncbi:hypothetical protein GOBAR_DD36388 [Gossypium barbadense]|nr:hypothetical protein GOBAR_DD36388 [Gossypium barbadense]
MASEKSNTEKSVSDLKVKLICVIATRFAAKLLRAWWQLNTAVNAYFSEGDRTNEQSSLHHRNFHSSFFDGDSGSTYEPIDTYPTEVRGVKYSHEPSSHAPVVEDASETAQALGPNSHETVTIGEVGDDSIAQPRWQNDNCNNQHVTPSAPAFDNLLDYGDDIEEQMIQAAIEASKRDAEASFKKRTLPI